MRIQKLIPAFVALILLAGAPLRFLPVCQSGPRAGLVCYCCVESGKKCARLCSGCHQERPGMEISQESSEMILDFVSQAVPWQSVFHEADFSPSLETVYLEVPVRPPIPV
jgi:hypothetical protein